MHVLVATDGNLDPQRAAAFAAALAGDGGSVTVLTVIAIPRRLLSDLRGVYGERAPAGIEGDAEYIGMMTEGGDTPAGWPGDQEMVDRYLMAKRDERCGPIADALAGTGVTVATKVAEGEQIARTVIAEAESAGADALLIGSHGEGRFEGVLGGTGTKLTRHAPCSVLIVR